MRYLSSTAIDQIADWQHPHCVSLFMPVKRAEVDQPENHVRLRHLLAQAQRQLVGRGQTRLEAEERLADLARLIDDRGFWRERGSGLVAYLAGEQQLVAHVDHALPEAVSVGEHCDILPVLAPAVDDERFALLAYSPNRVRLFSGDRGGLEEVEPEDLPRSMEAYEQILDEQAGLQHHAWLAPQHRTPHTEGRAGWHGHGGGGDDSGRNLRLSEYSRMVDQAVCAWLKPQALPLLVAASETLWPIYQRESDYHRLLDEAVRLNPDDLSPSDLHRHAWAIIEGRFEALRRADQAAFQEAVGRNGSSQIGEVLPAAYEGRIETLLVSTEDHIWGKFDPEARKLHTDPRPDGRNHDLLRLSAIVARRNGGRVRALPRAWMPDQAPIAAVFRY